MNARLYSSAAAASCPNLDQLFIFRQKIKFKDLTTAVDNAKDFRLTLTPFH